MIQSVERASKILDVVASHDEPVRLKDIAALCNLQVTTTSSLVSTLEACGFLAQEPQTRRYLLGTKIARLARQLNDVRLLGKIARQVLQELPRVTGCTACISTLKGLDVDYEAVEAGFGNIVIDPRHQVNVNTHATAMGKVLLAYSSPRLLERYLEKRGLLRLTDYTITDAEIFRQHLAQVRAEGWAPCNEESAEGVIAVAVPVFDEDDNLRASLGVVRPGTVEQNYDWKPVIEKLKQSAKELSRLLT